MESRKGASLKVFLVEDSALLRSRLASLLGAVPGLEVTGHAEGAKEAIDRIAAAAPQAVVLDLALKEGSGFDVLRTLGKIAPQIACYVLTNHAVSAFRASAQRLG